MSKQTVFNTIKKYTSEFFLIFISVVLAFALSEWSSNKGEKVSEDKLLLEIKNGIQTDYADFESNKNMHQISNYGVKTLRKWANQESINQDSLGLYYFVIFRNYSPIINKTGYESLKIANLKTITDDSLRFQIIKLYEYHYNIIEQLENHNEEMQDFKNYFALTNKLISKYLVFGENGKLQQLKPSTLSADDKNELLSYLWRMELTKKFKIQRYGEVMSQINQLNTAIDKEIKK